MRKFIFYIFLCMGTVHAAPQKNAVAKRTAPLTVAERTKTLNEFREFLKKPKYDLPNIDLFFYQKETEEVVPEVVQPVEVPKVFKASDHDMLVLQSVGRAIKPDGSLATGGQFVLCIQGSRILKVGDVLYARYRGNMYPITLKSVTRNQFTLQINDKEQTFQY
ncbi:MAG: hypothetical protein ACSW8C_00170 [bacterium]